MLLSPLFLPVALAIKLEDRGPVLFIQQRLGHGNRFFDMVKFRSMKIERGDAAGARSASRDDDRITRVGRFIRRTSIDELPQLVNVLRGEMSMVARARTRSDRRRATSCSGGSTRPIGAAIRSSPG